MEQIINNELLVAIFFFKKDFRLKMNIVFE